MTACRQPTMRINARLDDSAAEKLGYLQRHTGQSLSDVVRDSIEHYYAEIRERAERDAAALDDLVGAFDGTADSPSDLSTKYKDYLWPAEREPDDRGPDGAGPIAEGPIAEGRESGRSGG